MGFWVRYNLLRRGCDVAFTHPTYLCILRKGYVLFDWDNFLLAYMASLEAESLDIAYSNLIQTAQMRTMEGFVPNFER